MVIFYNYFPSKGVPLYLSYNIVWGWGCTWLMCLSVFP